MYFEKKVNSKGITFIIKSTKDLSNEYGLQNKVDDVISNEIGRNMRAVIKIDILKSKNNLLEIINRILKDWLNVRYPNESFIVISELTK